MVFERKVPRRIFVQDPQTQEYRIAKLRELDILYNQPNIVTVIKKKGRLTWAGLVSIMDNDKTL